MGSIFIAQVSHALAIVTKDPRCTRDNGQIPVLVGYLGNKPATHARYTVYIYIYIYTYMYIYLFITLATLDFQNTQPISLSLYIKT